MTEPELGFWAWGRREPGRLAVVNPDHSTATFGELLAACNQVVHGLRELGLKRGDNVAVVLPNHHTMHEVYLAAVQSGLYFTPINWHFTGPEIAYVVGDCEAKALIVHERFAEACGKALPEIDVPPEARFSVGHVDGFRPYEELKDGQPTDMPANRSPGAAMFYTSGTTGKPKGVRRPLADGDPDAIAAMSVFLPALFDINPGDDGVHIAPGPMYHTAVLVFSATALHLGHTAVLMDRFDPEDCLQRIERYRVTWSHLVPTHMIRMLQLPDDVRLRYDVSSLRSMVHAAAPCPIDVKRRMLEWWGPVVYEYYAATEGGGTYVKPDEWLERPGTVGRVWPTAELKIVDDDGHECPPGTPGTIYIKMATAQFEYHKDKEKTEENRLGDFFTVGDVGYFDEDGWLFLCDRKIDMVISGGVNIYPAEAENVLAGHPKVADVAVIGVPNPEFGEEVKGIIQPAPGIDASSELERELIAYCRERLAAYKCPRSVDFRDELPRTEAGKLLKRQLRDEYWADHDTKII